MSKVLQELAQSNNPIDQELSATLKRNQGFLASKGRRRSLGYEPRDILKHGSVWVIERGIRRLSSGFDNFPAEDSYEVIALKYPDSFNPEIVAIARGRLETADPLELDRIVKRLVERTDLPTPKGIDSPRKAVVSSNVFLRDASVKAFVINRAGGRCECCAAPAPFNTSSGLDYFEAHHMKTLVQGGSDTVRNTVALCPNCHRALHYASNAGELANRIYDRVTQLIRE